MIEYATPFDRVCIHNSLRNYLVDVLRFLVDVKGNPVTVVVGLNIDRVGNEEKSLRARGCWNQKPGPVPGRLVPAGGFFFAHPLV